MTREEIRGLIGGYAAGSLTPAERKLLFEAALEDQELFEELAREQPLKELLDQPAARTRLISALAPKAARARVPWLWAAVAAAAAVVVVVIFLRPPAPTAPKEIAQVQLQVQAPPPAPAIANAPAPVANAPAPAAAAPRQHTARRDEAARASTGARTTLPEAPPPEPPPPAAAAAPPPPAVSEPKALAQNGLVAGAAVGGAADAVRLSAKAAIVMPFAFDYSLTPDGHLRIVPASAGFLTVAANDGNTQTVLFTSRRVAPAAVNEIDLPAGSVSALIIFSAQEMVPGFLNFVLPLDPPSGTKSDPNPSPTSRLIANVPVR